MAYKFDPRIEDAKNLTVPDVLARLGVGNLKPMSGELIGPCPLCGGKDRFGINLRKKAFLCHSCKIRGGDNIALVMSVQGVTFPQALSFLCGDAPAQIDPEEIKRRRAAAADAARRQEAAQAAARKRSIEDARAIWTRAQPCGDIVRAYFKTRGFNDAQASFFAGLKTLRFIAEHRYSKRVSGHSGWVGPALIAAITNSRGDVTAVHQTYLAPEPPHGKAKIIFEGETLPAKLVRGAKKGGAIRLYTNDSDTLIVGEGIETTLTALAAKVHVASYWAGVDLGNMAGRMRRGLTGVPDLDDKEAFVPPDWVRRLIFIQDGDSNPDTTRAKLDCGLHRAMAHRPGIVCQIVHAGDGVDLNDLIRENN